MTAAPARLSPTLPRPRFDASAFAAQLAAEAEKPEDRAAIRTGIIGILMLEGKWTDAHAAVLWDRPDAADLLARAKAWIREGEH